MPSHPKCHPREPYPTRAQAQAATRYYTQYQAIVYRCNACKKYHLIFA